MTPILIVIAFLGLLDVVGAGMALYMHEWATAGQFACGAGLAGYLFNGLRRP